MNEPTFSLITPKRSLDLSQSLVKQMAFLHQVSLPHYGSHEFLLNALARYKRFLYLSKIYKSKTLVPTVDIDLIWRAHQLDPEVYAGDCDRILGRILNHEESIKHYAKGEEEKN